MFRCLFIKRKLYDYLDNSLSEADRIRVKEHLEDCAICQKQLNQMGILIDLAKNKKMPQLSEDFWHDFKTGLDKKLNSRLIPEFRFKTTLSPRLKPVLVYALVLIVILVTGLYFYNQPKFLSRRDLDLVNEISLIEEVTQDPLFNHNEDAYIEELNLLYQFDQRLI